MLLKPAVRVMNRLSFPKKFALISAFFSAVMQTVRGLEAPARRMIGGEMGSGIDVSASNEMGRVVKSFNDIAERLRIECAQFRAMNDNLDFSKMRRGSTTTSRSPSRRRP